jgi:hypothetical protein
MFRRGNYFWSHDGETGKQETLRTKDNATALRLLHSKNEAFQKPILNLQIARTYLTASDPEIGKRTWQTVMSEIVLTKKNATRVRWDRAIKDKAFNLLRDQPLLETRAEHFLDALRLGTVSTNVHLRNGINFATALLFDRFQKTSGRRRFIQRINALRQNPPLPRTKLDATVVIVPGALYLERPDMGGDGRLVREVAEVFGCQTNLIPLVSFGSVKENAGLISSWLAQHSHEQIVLVSLSKGGADLKMALAAPDAGRLFRNVTAWVNVGGPLNGSRMTGPS